MLLYHWGWTLCCCNVQSNVGHNLFWIENKYYLIRSLGELTRRQGALTSFGLGPRCQSRCLRFYRRVTQFRARWGRAGSQASGSSVWVIGPSARCWMPSPRKPCWWHHIWHHVTGKKGAFTVGNLTCGTWIFRKSFDVIPQKGWEWFM